MPVSRWLVVLSFCIVAISAETFLIQSPTVEIRSEVPSSFVKVQFGSLGDHQLSIQLLDNTFAYIDEDHDRNKQTFTISSQVYYYSSADSPSSGAEASQISGILCFVLSAALCWMVPGQNWIKASIFVLFFSASVLVFCQARSIPSSDAVPLTVLVTLDYSLIDTYLEIFAPSSLVDQDVLNSGITISCSTKIGKTGQCQAPLCFYANETCFNDNVSDLLLVGILLSTTGDFRVTGSQMLDAMELAIDNQDTPVFFIFADTESDPTVARQRADELYHEGVRIFLGPITSAEGDELYQWSQSKSDDTLFISPGLTVDIFGILPNFISLSMANSATVAAIDLVLSNTQDVTNAVVFYRDDLFGQDTVEKLEATANINVLGTLAYSPESSFEDIQNSVFLLNDLVEGLDVSVVITLSYDEIGYIMTAVGDYPNLLELYWIGSGFALDCTVERPGSLEVAQQVQLSALQYRGNKVDNNSLRKQVLSTIKETTNCSVTPYVTNAFDSVLLLLQSTRISRTKDVALVKEGVVASSYFIYGATGWLGLNNETLFRDGEEFSYSSIAPPNILNTTWAVYESVFLHPSINPDVFGPWEKIAAYIGAYVIDPEHLSGCSAGYVEIQYYDVTSTLQNVSIIFPIVEEIAIPVYDTFTVAYVCDESLVKIHCPYFYFGQYGHCSIESKLISRLTTKEDGEEDDGFLEACEYARYLPSWFPFVRDVAGMCSDKAEAYVTPSGRKDIVV